MRAFVFLALAAACSPKPTPWPPQWPAYDVRVTVSQACACPPGWRCQTACCVDYGLSHAASPDEIRAHCLEAEHP